MGLLSNTKFQRVDQMSRKYQEIRDCIHLEHTVSHCWCRFSVGTLTDSLPQDQKINMASRDAIVGTYSNREEVGISAYLPLKGKSRRGMTPRKPESPVRRQTGNPEDSAIYKRKTLPSARSASHQRELWLLPFPWSTSG